MTTLTQRQLNRTFLERQYLLQRTSKSPIDVISDLVALQSQEANSPYEALWTRVKGFQPEHLDALFADRSVVRGTWFRSTVQTTTASDYLAYRGVHSSYFLNGVDSYLEGIEGTDWVETLRLALSQAGPVHGPQFAAVADSTFPGYVPETWRAHMIRRAVPMLRHPKGDGGRTLGPRDAWVEVESYLHRLPRPAEEVRVDELIRKYLAAYGPASIRDASSFLGITRLREWFDSMELVQYSNEDGGVLYDLPQAVITDESVEAPTLLMASFDHTILGHADRSRIIDQAHSPIISGPNAMFKPYVLLDGQVAGYWTYTMRNDEVYLKFRYFTRPTSDQERTLIAEARLWCLAWYKQYADIHFDIDMYDPTGD